MSEIDPDTWKRRHFMKQTLGFASATTLLSAVPRTRLAGARAGGSERLEKNRLVLGVIALTDCAPIVVARELGYFARHGLEVEISREASWASIRDKVAVGALDGAHMLAGMPIASSLGVGGRRRASTRSGTCAWWWCRRRRWWPAWKPATSSATAWASRGTRGR